MKGDMQKWSPNVADILENSRKLYPTGEIVSKMVAGDIHRTNYSEVCIRARKLASSLEKDGYREGNILGTLALNTYRHLEIYYGISGMGAITHTLNFRLHPEQATYIVNHAEDKAIFCELPFVSILESIQEQIPCVEKFIILCEESEMPQTDLREAISYEAYIERGDENYQWPRMADDAACALCYTSGTTGNPKGVLYSHSSQVLHASTGAIALELRYKQSILMVVPMFHVCAWGLPYIGPMLGSKLVMPGIHMDGQSLYEMMEEESVELAFGVPTIWMQLLGYCRDNNKILSSVERTVIGGSALSLFILQEFEELHDVNVTHAWGMTEMSPLGVTNLNTPEMRQMSREEKYALKLKQGKAFYGIEIKIVNDSGAELPNDGKAFGHLMVRGPYVLKRYFKAETDAVDADGWFDTGDISTIDQHGYMTIVDRAKDVIKSGGEWISSIDLENAAFGHPDVAEACVVGIPHPKWDERPLLFLVTNSGEPMDKESMRKFLGLRVAKWWIPDDIVFLSELPHGATGKLQKYGLREEYATHFML